MRTLHQKLLLTLALLLATGLTSSADDSYVDPAPEGMAGATATFFHPESGSYLGIDSQDVSADRLSALKLKDERGVEVLMVDQDAPAGKAGLKEHDVILTFNSANVEGVEQLRRLIREEPPGRTVTLGISRDGQPLNLTVKLADRADSAKHTYSYAWSAAPPVAAVPPVAPLPKMPDFDIQIPDISENIQIVTSSSRSGLLVENLTPQLGQYFGVKKGEGILVRSVEKGSAAEAAGLRAGDVIVQVNGQHISSRGDWNMTMRNHRTGKVTLGIVRDKKEQTVPLVLPEVKSPDESSIFEFDMPDLDESLHQLELKLDKVHLERIRVQALTEASRELKKAAKQLDSQSHSEN